MKIIQKKLITFFTLLICILTFVSSVSPVDALSRVSSHISSSVKVSTPKSSGFSTKPKSNLIMPRSGTSTKPDSGSFSTKPSNNDSSNNSTNNSDNNSSKSTTKPDSGNFSTKPKSNPSTQDSSKKSESYNEPTKKKGIFSSWGSGGGSWWHYYSMSRMFRSISYGFGRGSMLMNIIILIAVIVIAYIVIDYIRNKRR